MSGWIIGRAGARPYSLLRGELHSIIEGVGELRSHKNLALQARSTQNFVSLAETAASHTSSCLKCFVVLSHRPTQSYKQPSASTVPVANIAIASAAGRYAAALFQLAQEDNSLDAIASDMSNIEQLFGSNPDLRFALSNPDFPQPQKYKAFQTICDKLGTHKLTQNTIGVLSQNSRIALIGEVATHFTSLLARHRNQQHAEVITAIPLNSQQQEQIQNLLEKSIGGKIKLSLLTDPRILAGIIVKIGSLMIDASLSAKLKSLETEMKEIK